MSSYPKRVKEFVPWSKAMVQGATVGNPSYPSGSKARTRVKRKRFFRKSKKRKMQDA